MQIGNATYDKPEDLPTAIPVFPLEGVVLLPRAQIPLNVFEPRYQKMIEDVMAGSRIIGIVQPDFDFPEQMKASEPPLRRIGCAGRITAFQEVGGGRYIITLTGISRFETLSENSMREGFRCCEISAHPYLPDFSVGLGEEDVDRGHLLKTLRDYLEANSLEADWSGISNARTESLVNALAIMSPYGPAEKQALLEAPDLKTRAETLVALTEVDLARRDGDDGIQLQ